MQCSVIAGPMWSVKMWIMWENEEKEKRWSFTIWCFFYGGSPKFDLVGVVL